MRAKEKPGNGRTSNQNPGAYDALIVASRAGLTKDVHLACELDLSLRVWSRFVRHALRIGLLERAVHDRRRWVERSRPWKPLHFEVDDAPEMAEQTEV
jgi:hypothetical protein